MFSSSKRGRARRASTARRRVAPRVVEGLEPRALLTAGPFGINVELGAYQSYVNWLQVPGNWITAPNQSNPIVLNASGDPNSDATLLFDYRVNQWFNGPDPGAVPPPLDGTYHLSFNGQATITAPFGWGNTAFAVRNQAYDAATNTTTADLVVPPGNTSQFFGIGFIDSKATPTSAVDTGISNARLIRPGYAANSTQLYSNEFLAALKPYSVLRYVVPDNVNNQPYFGGPSNHTLMTVDAPQVDQTGTPWEYQVALANQTHTDMWINIPEGATDAYVKALAGIIKGGGTVNGVTYPGLDPSLKVYLEYSNEVWGGIPFNQYYQEEAVQDTADNHPLSTFPSNAHVYDNIDGTTTSSATDAAGRRYLERTNDIGRIFQGALGADPTHQRIRPVLGWQENNFNYWPTTLDWFQHYIGSASDAFYGMGNATYFQPADASLTSVDAAINSLAAAESSYAIPNTVGLTTLATYYGLKNVSYEGGPAIGGDPRTNPSGAQVALATSRDPRVEQLVYQHYVNYYANGGDTAAYFSGPFGTWVPLNEWETAELAQYGNPSASPKYRGTVDVANAAPVAVTAGARVTTTGPTSFDARTDSLGDDFSKPNTGQRAYWLLNVAATGLYDLKLSTGSNAGPGPGEVTVFINQKPYGGVYQLPASSTIDLGNLPLSAGLSTLSLSVQIGSSSSALSTPYYQFSPTTFTIAPQAVPAIGDAGFEAVPLPAGGLATDPTGSAWAFTGSAGVSSNGSSLTSGNPAAPQGTQVAFLQNTGSFSQNVPGWAGGSYVLSFAAAQRGNIAAAGEDFQVLVDGAVVGTFHPNGPTYQAYSTGAFTVTAGAHRVTFLGLGTAGGTNAALIDSVGLAGSAPPAPAPPPVAPPPSAGPVVGDAGFESVPMPAGGFSYATAGSAWAFSGGPGSGSGVSANGSGFTSGNPAAPGGSQVAFLESYGTMTQSVAGWAAGSYRLSLLAAQRANYGASNEDFQVLVDGVVVATFQPAGPAYQAYTTAPFTVAAGTHAVTLRGLDSSTGDRTALIDNVAIVADGAAAPPPPPPVAPPPPPVAPPPPPVAPPPSAGPVVGDAGFESVPMPAGGFSYATAGSAWAFSGGPGSGSGVSANGSGFTSGNPAAPGGSQVAFLESYGTMTQSVAGWAAGSYRLSLLAAQRANYGASNEDFQVLVDGVVVATFQPAGPAYQAYTTAPFTVAAGTHAVTLRGLDSSTGDRTALIDNVAIVADGAAAPPPPPPVAPPPPPVAPPPPPVAPPPSAGPVVGDAGFESVPMPAGGFSYATAGSAWAFSGGPGSGSGVSANGSGFTSGNPAAPGGSQVAFLESYGTMTQSVAGWAAGSYRLSLLAAQRANYGASNEDFQVLVDGVVVATFQPAGPAYQAYTTAPFTVAAGTHAVTLRGLDSSTGDRTALIDNVAIASA